MQSYTEIRSNEPATFLDGLNSEQSATLKLLYNLWRLDSAARSFPHDSSDQVEIATNKARWTIGLTMEMVRFSIQ